MKDNYRMKLIFSALTMLLMLLSSSLVVQNLIIYGNFDDNQWESFDTDYVHNYGLGGDGDTGKFYLGNNAHNNGNQIYDCEWPHAKQQVGLGHDPECASPFLL